MPAVVSDDFAIQGYEVYDRVVVPTLRPEDKGKFVVVDVVSEDFEIDADDYTASKRLRNRRPDGQFWLMRAGYPTAYKAVGMREVPF